MKKSILLILILYSFSFYSQNVKAPVYHSCSDVVDTELEDCFLKNLKSEFLTEFIFREKIMQRDDQVLVMFTVSKEGKYIINYSNSSYKTVKNEILRVFETLPPAEPATYNGHNIESQYVFSFDIPISKNFITEETKKVSSKAANLTIA